MFRDWCRTEKPALRSALTEGTGGFTELTRPGAGQAAVPRVQTVPAGIFSCLALFPSQCSP